MRNGLATGAALLAVVLAGCGGSTDKDKAKRAYQTIATCRQGQAQPQITAAVDALRGLMVANPHDAVIAGYGRRAVDAMRRCTGTG